MKNGSNKKGKIIIFVILMSLLITGYVFYVPKLKNADNPFIVLNGNNGDSIGAAKSAAQNAYNAEHPISTPTPTATPAPKEDGKMRVTVSDETIAFGSLTNLDFNRFKKVFENGALDSKEIILVDDYAEARTFSKIIKLFEKAGKEYEVETKK